MCSEKTQIGRSVLIKKVPNILYEVIESLIRMGGGGRRGLGFFAQDFLPIEKQNFFFLTVREPKYFFQDKAKTIFFFFFSKQHICSKCILLDLYVRVFLEPNIHGYIVYMFVYTCILDIWVRVFMSRDMTKPTKWSLKV